MRILVCGSRNWDDKQKMKDVIGETFVVGDTLISGCARGADKMAIDIIQEFEMSGDGLYYGLKLFPANWDKHGKAAGVIRNQQMLDEGKPEIVLAFSKDIKNSRGTFDMISRANKAGIEVRLYS